nr:hypothetical protein [Tanacetum cinerariifolium]
MVVVNHVMDIIVNHDENYLCNLCGNNLHDGYDCQQQFLVVYEQEPSYNQNYDDNYYPHESLSFPCCDYFGGSHETFQCQPDNQNIDFSRSDQIQTPQYPDVNPPSLEISNEEIFQAKGDLIKSIQTFLERFNCIPFEEKPQILFQTWETFFAIQYSQPEDSNELFQKLLKDLKELAEYDQSISTERPILLNDNHSVQNKESPENSSEEIIVSNPDQQEATTDTELLGIEDIHPLAQKQKMEDTMLELVKICQEKEFLCIHDDIDNLIESTLDSKLLSINLINSQCFDKKEQRVKNVEEQPAKRRNHAEKSLQNFRVIHKSSISLNTSQISSIHEVAPILSTKEPKHLLTIGYEHPSITPETESDEVTKSNAENLLPIPSKCEVTLEDEIECDMPAKDVCSLVFTTFLNHLFKDNDDFDSSDDESLPDEDVPAEEFKIYSNPLCDEDEINSDKLNSHCFNVESDFVESLLNRGNFIDFSSKFDFSGELAHIKPEIPKSDFDFEEEIRLIENLVYDNSLPRSPKELNAEIADTIIESIPVLPIPVQNGNSQQEEINIVTKTDDVLPPSVENDNDDYDLLLGEADLFLDDNSIPSGIENENTSISRPPPEPPDDNFDLKPEEISAVMEDIDEPDEYFNPGGEIFVSTKIEDDNYFPFMFVIRFFLQYFIFPEISPLLLSAGSEDTIFDPGISD